MNSGRRNQVTKQVGEYLVASELARRGLLVATFSGNVPDFDLIATDGRGFSIPVQVKTATAGSWQFNMGRFVDIAFDGERQIMGDKKPLAVPDLVYVFVKAAAHYGRDEFFILDEGTLQDVLINHHRGVLAYHGGIRPKQPYSLHAALQADQFAPFRDNWEAITGRFPPAL
jgi:hypothetical protein